MIDSLTSSIIKFILMVVAITLLLHSVHSSDQDGTISNKNFVTCQSVPGKSPGQLDYRPGIVNDTTIEPYENHTNENHTTCQHKCIQDTNCFMSEFQYQIMSDDNGTCHLYNTIGNIRVFWPAYPLLLWHKCNYSDSNICFQPSSNRCGGNFVLYSEYKFIQKEAFYVQKTFKSLTNAQEFCLKTNTCGSVSYEYGKGRDRYTLNNYWPYPNDIEYTPGWNTYVWKCCDIPSKINDSLHWVEDKDPVIIGQENYLYTVTFETLSVNSCLKECDDNPNCDKPFFNKDYSWCMLRSKSGCQCSTPYPILPKNLTFHGFSRSSLHNSHDLPLSNLRSPLNISEDNSEKCVCILDPRGVRLYPNYCDGPGSIPIEDKQLYSGMAFYYMFRENNGSYLVSTGTGPYLWLKPPNTKQLNFTCEPEQCKLFDAGIVGMKKLEIVTRDQWMPHQVNTSDYIFFNETRIPRFVVIGETEIPICRCFTKDSCSSACRQRQIYFTKMRGFTDIPENFLIGSDGRVYEGRGWDVQGATVLDYNGVSLSICFIGDYNKTEITLEALDAAKLLIEEGLRLKKIDPNYFLRAHVDLRPHGQSPIRKVFLIIQNWKHYNKYLYMKYVCWSLIIKWTLLSLASCLTISIIFIFLYNRFYRSKHTHSSLCERLTVKHELRGESILHFYAVSHCSEQYMKQNFITDILFEESSHLTQNPPERICYISKPVCVIVCDHITRSCQCKMNLSLMFRLANIDSCSNVKTFAQFFSHSLRKCDFLIDCPHRTFVLHVQSRHLAESESVILIFHRSYETDCHLAEDIWQFEKKHFCLCGLSSFLYDIEDLMKEDDADVSILSSSSESKRITLWRHCENVSCGDRLVNFSSFLNSPWMWSQSVDKNLQKSLPDEEITH